MEFNKEERTAVKKIAKLLICYGVDRVVAHEIARAQVRAKLVRVAE